MDIEIESLTVRIENAAGHEHRIGPIAALAAELLAHRLAAGLPSGGAENKDVSLDLSRTSDREAAARIAGAALEAVRFGLTP